MISRETQIGTLG